MKQSKILSAGLAMFAMMFGAGNVFLPLALGRDVGTSIWIALAGFCLTAALVPLLGVIVMTLFEGDYKKFLGSIGAIPGALIAMVCMLLIGPFGFSSRCVTLAYGSVAWYLPGISLFVFSVIAMCLVFAMTFKKTSVIDVMGRFLGPLKLILLVGIIILGLLFPAHATGASLGLDALDAFTKGFFSGYGTGDLLAAIFFSGLIFSSLREPGLSGKEENHAQLAIKSLKAGAFGALLLALVYSGFCIVASLYAFQLQGIDRGQLLSVLAHIILGASGGLLANITVAFACLTTTIALTTVFAEYLSKEVFANKISYLQALIATIIATLAMANLGLSGIMAVIEPIVFVCYPALIVLAFVNIAHKLFGFKYIKTPVYLVFFISMVLKLW